MSDYLDNLVARSLGLSEVVQPRPLSIFEPLRPAGLPAPDPFSLEEVGEPSSNLGPLRVASSAPDVKLSEAPPASHREPQSARHRNTPFRLLDAARAHPHH